ncbi:MAG: serine--tRNA ligase, partial [Lachnospiraceae bacterium]|nr:serine--tRNA ligase [Lachnospiraceae bacterium]
MIRDLKIGNNGLAETFELDLKLREAKSKGDELRADRNRISKEIGMYMAKKQLEDAENAKATVKKLNDELVELEAKEV